MDEQYNGPFTGEQIDEAIRKAMEDGVDSFNGRKGAVRPQKNDYVADQIGFTPGDTGMSSENVQEAIKELFTSVSEGKSMIASAITDKGIETAADATFEAMKENILAIETGGGLPEDLYTISVSAEPEGGGTVSGGGVASGGMTVTVNAEEQDGYGFAGWEENAELVSEIKNITFQVQESRDLTAVFFEKKLPAGYTELQYIAVAADNRWIDTGVFPDWNTKIVLDAKLASLPGSSVRYYLFGETPFEGSADSGSFYLYANPSGYAAFQFNFLSVVQSHISVSNPTSRHTFILSNSEAEVSGNKASNYSPTETEAVSTRSLALFACKTGSAGVFGTARAMLYSCQIYDGEILVRDFVPCKENESGSIGLYDLKNHQFYCNAGTGSFGAGPAV